MYDTVNFRLTADKVRAADFLEEVPCYLDDDTIGFHDYQGERIVTGCIGGLKVSVSKFQVKIKDGSLCKWHLGDNFKTMGRSDTQRAVERLSDTLHLPIDKSSVTRIDIAQNIILKSSVDVYLNHLGTLNRAKRLPTPDGLYYISKGGCLCFYDKNKEQKSKGDTIPELFQGRNVLRYEQRYTSRLAAQFNVADVTGAFLYDEAFYIDILKRWRDSYKAIQKTNDITLNFQAMRGKKQFHKMSVLAMVKLVGGEIELINQINEAQKRGDLTKKQAFDIRQIVKSACTGCDSLTMQNESIAELDKKIMEAVRFYR